LQVLLDFNSFLLFQGIVTICLLIEVLITVRGLGWGATVPFLIGYLWTLSVAVNNVRFVVGGSVAAWCSMEAPLNPADVIAKQINGQVNGTSRVAPIRPHSPLQTPRITNSLAPNGFNLQGLGANNPANRASQPEAQLQQVQGWMETVNPEGLGFKGARKARRKVVGTASFVKWAVTKSSGSICGSPIVNAVVWLVDWAVYIMG
jgi:hypothetical protein